MPPSGHSSSHHSSSHSSHSFSHHSSYSGHSSSHHSSSSSSGGSYRTSTSRRSIRISQPYGWNYKTNGKIEHFHCLTHDYDYYSQGWIASDGRRFEEGYYDENGHYYTNVAVSGETTVLKCSYCGNHKIYKWTEGDLPVCENCGAPFQIDIIDKKDKVYYEEKDNRNVFWVIFVLSAVEIILPILIFFIISSIQSIKYHNNSDKVVYESVSEEDSIYIEEIGRTCYKDGEDWYDSQTQCWFWYNDTVPPYMWQYWYEGISSDYGKYGWMEYDMDEEEWYIETDENNWERLPEYYDTSGLWHMTDEFVNPY